MSGRFSHIPVMLDETIDALCLSAGKIAVDATAGGAGHNSEIYKKIPGGRLVAIDKDPAAIEHTQSVLLTQSKFMQNAGRFDVVHDSFVNISKILCDAEIEKVDAVLADLGVSSHQIDTAERGFSYMSDAPLDMRMNPLQKKSAYDVVNYYKTEHLAQIIKDFGEERFANRIARAIADARPVETTLQLSDIIKGAVPGNYFRSGGHPAKRTFQAIRIEVNEELYEIEKFIRDSVEKLSKGGRIAIITFHSLEDRIVKQTFKELASDCICPPKSPICICGHHAKIKLITKKPIEPTLKEQQTNPRSHSAKLRIAEKI